MNDKIAALDEGEQLQVILEYYADRENIGVVHTDVQRLYDVYLSKILNIDEVSGRRILEIGAGCSQYIPLFLNNNCDEYFANDLIPERLAKSRVSDNRYHEVPGDFLKINLPKNVDIVITTLTMMFLRPYFQEFASRIAECLKPGGIFISMEPNYFCPLNLARANFSKNVTPTLCFNPFTYARYFKNEGFEVEKMVPFTSRFPWTTGNWALGTAFWMRARKL